MKNEGGELKLDSDEALGIIVSWTIENFAMMLTVLTAQSWIIAQMSEQETQVVSDQLLEASRTMSRQLHEVLKVKHGPMPGELQSLLDQLLKGGGPGKPPEES